MSHTITQPAPQAATAPSKLPALFGALLASLRWAVLVHRAVGAAYAAGQRPDGDALRRITENADKAVGVR